MSGSNVNISFHCIAATTIILLGTVPKESLASLFPVLFAVSPVLYLYRSAQYVLHSFQEAS